MKLYGTEPLVDQWTASGIAEIVKLLPPPRTDSAVVIAVDGHSGGGKTTFAKLLAAGLEAALLSTDDFAWWHSMFDWHDILIPNGIRPLRALQSIDYQPPAWIERDRQGSIKVEAKPYLIVEGVGAMQSAMRAELDFCIWVQSDVEVAEARGIARDLAERPDPIEAKRFWDEWQAQEVPFQERERSWEVADLLVCGTCRDITANTVLISTKLS
jgi:uridine kinase